MKEPYQKYFEMSIVHFMAYPQTMGGEGPIIDTLTEIALDPFFTAVEVGQIKDSKVRREAAKLLDQAHLRVCFGAQPILLSGKHNLNSPHENQRNRAIDAVKGGIEQAYELGAERLALLSGPAPKAEAEREEHIKLLCDSLKQLCEHADQGGLGITLEIFDPDVDKKALIGSSEDAAKVAEEVKKEHPSFGIMVDLSHLPLQRERPHEALPKVAKHLVHVHIGNCMMKDPAHPAYGDQHPRFGIEGGEIDVPQVIEFIKALFAVGFLGGEKKPFVGFEVKPQEELAGVVIANAKRVFNEAWAKVEVQGRSL
jgi:sugar phosphate isomerase/epimerase